MKTFNTNLKTFTALTFALSLVVMPTLGFADNDDKNKSNNGKNDKSCVKAWGQLLKNGWKETKVNLSVSENCKVPYGIFKKWNFVPHAPRATSTDVTAPIISVFQVNPENTTANVRWSANEKVQAMVFYGTTSPVVVKNTVSATSSLSASVSSTNGTALVLDGGYNAAGNAKLRNLAPGTVYYAVLAVRDRAGNITISKASVFTTTFVADTKAPIISSIMTTIKNATTLNISWITNELSTSKVFYGTSTINVGSASTLQVGSSSLNTTHSFDLPILSTTTPEKFIIQSTDASGNTQTSGEYSVFLSF